MPLDETHGISLWPETALVLARRPPSEYSISDRVAQLRGFSAALAMEHGEVTVILDEIIDGLVEELAR